MSPSLLDAVGGSGSKRNMSQGVGDGGRHLQRCASPQCLLPVPLPDPDMVTSLHSSVCHSTASAGALGPLAHASGTIWAEMITNLTGAVFCISN